MPGLKEKEVPSVIALPKSIDTDNFCAIIRQDSGQPKRDKVKLPFEQFGKKYTSDYSDYMKMDEMDDNLDLLVLDRGQGHVEEVVEDVQPDGDGAGALTNRDVLGE